ncbi:MAG: hypothetical protein M3Y34_04330, partial [Actinomycetota bacterium]|nr:hypothetical protein [Actinomycetota bacterium]
MTATEGVSGLSPAALREHGERHALVTEEGVVTHADLARRVERAAADLGAERRLILLATRIHPDAVVLYLAALAGRHPLILVDAANRNAIASLVSSYDPDLVAAPADDDTDRWE